ncbi:MAG: YhgE/Pip domain-containing protein, partial [Arcanobacterium sp.]|nr:YhgE/Pip domain-containing protein [Arcanobacterium sp.]
PAGRQMIATLTNPQHSSHFQWAVVSATSASKGLRDGTYEAVVEIPHNFSAAVAAVLQNTATDPGVITVRTNGRSALLADISREIVNAAGKDLSTSFTVSYITESLAATSKIKSGFSQAASGATQLADGVAQAADGATSLAAGSAALADGTTQLSSGAQQLASGVTQLNTGAQPLASGAAGLAQGLNRYMAGVNRAADGAVPLASGARELSQGVQGYVDGVQRIYDGITTPQPGQSTSMLGGAQQLADALTKVATGIHTVADELVKQLPGGLTGASHSAQLLSDGFSKLTNLIDQCSAGNQTACTQAATGTAQTAQGLATLAEQLQKAADAAARGEITLEELTKITNPADQLAEGARSLADGLGTLAEQINSQMLGTQGAAFTKGATQLADGTGQLADGLQQLKRNGPQLTAGAQQLADGANRLASGTPQLADGAAQLADGAAQTADGTAQLADGAQALASGQNQLTDGSRTLAKQLTKAADQIPSYTRAEAEHTASALGAPVRIAAPGALVDPRSALTPGLAALALWLGALGTIIYRSSMASKKLNEPLTPLALTVRSLISAIGIGAAQSLLVLIGLAVSKVPIEHLFSLIALLLFTSFTMMALHVAFTATLGMKGGSILSLIFLGLQIVALNGLLPAASDSALVNALHSFLPMPQAQDALMSAITGIGSSSVAVWILIFWFLASLFSAVAAVAKRRTLDVASLRTFATRYIPLARR